MRQTHHPGVREPSQVRVLQQSVERELTSFMTQGLHWINSGRPGGRQPG
jgi:hypothetical protein